MMLKTLIKQAYSENFAIGAFNFYNIESAQAISDAANETGNPVILMLTETSIEYAGLENLYSVFSNIKSESKVDLYLHLDHGTDVGLIKKAIGMKFDSVMFDGSKLPFEQNVIISKELRQEAHRKGVVFEAEIGKVGGNEDNVSSELFKTNPQEALNFFDQVKPDILAVAIGNIHGYKTAAEQLDFSLLAKIQDILKTPLVLHGCSNREPKEYSVAISEGIVKINIDTELRESFVEGVRKSLKSKEKDPRKILGQAKQEIKNRTKSKINIFTKTCC